MNDSMQIRASLFKVEAELKDWTSLIPSCLDFSKEARGSRQRASYNCESSPNSYRFPNLTVRFSPLVILLVSSHTLSRSDASLNTGSKGYTRLQSPEVVFRGAGNV